MKIISGWDTARFGGMNASQYLRSKRAPIDLNTITDQERQEIQKQHEEAVKENPTWAFFGGIINLGHRHFQVMP